MMDPHQYYPDQMNRLYGILECYSPLVVVVVAVAVVVVVVAVAVVVVVVVVVKQIPTHHVYRQVVCFHSNLRLLVHESNQNHRHLVELECPIYHYTMDIYVS